MEEYKKWNKLAKDTESFEKQVDKMHLNELGLGTPEDYFVKSKTDILNRVNGRKKSKSVPFYRNRVAWIAAAGAALILALTVFKSTNISTVYKIPNIISDTVGEVQNFDLASSVTVEEDDFLIASLFVDESQIDSYVDNYIVEETIIDEYIDNFLLDDMTGDTMNLYWNILQRLKTF